MMSTSTVAQYSPFALLYIKKKRKGKTNHWDHDHYCKVNLKIAIAIDFSIRLRNIKQKLILHSSSPYMFDNLHEANARAIVSHKVRGHWLSNEKIDLCGFKDLQCRIKPINKLQSNDISLPLMQKINRVEMHFFSHPIYIFLFKFL